MIARPRTPRVGSSHSEDHGKDFLDELKEKAEDVIDSPETSKDVGEFAPVAATEPEVAAVEDATAGAAEQSASGTASAASSVDEALGSQEAAGDTEGDSEST